MCYKNVVKHYLTILTLLAGLLAGASASAELYKWVDENGVVHYGDHIPPEYADDPHQRFNQSGVRIGDVEGAISEQERAARAEQERLRLEQERYDRQLLMSYEQVSDIERLREARLADLDQQDNLARNYLASLETRLFDLEIEADRYNYPHDPDSDKPAIPENLLRELSETAANVTKYQEVLAEREQERDKLIAGFERDLRRFQELKTPR